MKFYTALVVAVAAHMAAGAAVGTNGALSKQEIVDTLLENPHLLTPNSYTMLKARAGLHEKRQVPKGGLGGIDLGGLLQGLGGLNVGGLLQGAAGLLLPNPAAPVSKVPEVQDQESTAWPGAKRRKIRYGPYRIPPTSEKNLESEILNVQGMANTFKLGAKKPCDGECTVLGLQADIEYADGKPASNAQGAWFHHAVLLNAGPEVMDGNCGTSKIDNMFMSGNERSMNGYGLPGAQVKSGYRLHKADSFVLTTELMNLQDKEQWVWLTISYEFLEGHQADYKDGRMLWMSIGPIGLRCGGSTPKSPWGASNLTLSQQPKLEVFSEHSMPWTAPRDGFLLATGGHMHDGGSSLEVFHNDKVICKSVPAYTKEGEKGHGMGGMKHKRQIAGGSKPNNDIAHIKKQEGCTYPEGKPLKKGDTLYIQANYDFKRFPGMKNKKGDLDEVMGISGSIVAY